MKQILKTMLFGAMATTLWSCSNDNLPGTDTNTPTFYGDGYLAVDIQLPTQTGDTRANDKFDDGVASEYAVKDGVILLFTGDSETAATFQGAYNILPMDGVTGSDQITTTYSKVLKVNNFTVVGNIYGLVMLNYEKVGSIVTNQGFKIGDNPPLTNASKFEDVLKYTQSTSTAKVNDNPFVVDNGKYFFMTNTVLCSAKGGSTDPSSGALTTLANLGTQLYGSETEALQKVSGSIFVERGVAKITMSMKQNVSLSVPIKEGGNAENGASPLSMKSAEFALGNLEYDSYVVRNMNDTPLGYYTGLNLPNQDLKYRFVGALNMGLSSLQEPVNYYRTYWCEDPHYATDHTYHADLTDYANCDGTSPLYCFENTFTVADQTWKNTTRAVVKVVFNNGDDFYTIYGDDQTYYTETNAKSHVTKFISENQTLQEEIKAVLQQTTGKVDYSQYFDVNYSTKLTRKGILKVKEVKPSDALKAIDSTKTSFTCAENVVKEVNKFVKLYKYVDGASYYSIMIKHFGDDQTPWAHANDKDYDASSVEKSYGKDTEGDKTASKNYLGRYGLVRNNWYDLEITALKKLGSPVVPAIGEIKDPEEPDPTDPHDPDTPDDNNIVEKYIAFKVNVLNWAKRTHGYELK